MKHESAPRAWVEVDVEAIAHNLGVARRASGGSEMMPVVKANAYGHGLETVARRLDSEGAVFFGVANVGEARRLVQADIRTCPFILGPTLPDEREEIVCSSWGCTISSVEEAESFERLAALYGRDFTVHVAVDTGMGREGFLPEQLGEVAARLKTLPHLAVKGVMSHFPSADEDETFTREQVGLYADCVAELRQHFELAYCHIAASAGELSYSIPVANLVRPGLLLYGVAPVESPWAAELQPTLRLLSRVTLVRELPMGHGVSYGRTWVAPRSSRIATIGIGYADGWNRHLGGVGAYVVIHGQRCPIVGRITMDMLMADVSALPEVAAGDEVELIGSALPVQQVAAWAGTIPWEIYTGLGVRLPRVYKRFAACQQA